MTSESSSRFVAASTSSIRDSRKNSFGVLEEIRAPNDRVVLFITTSPAVADDGLLLGLGADLGALT